MKGRSQFGFDQELVSLELPGFRPSSKEVKSLGDLSSLRTKVGDRHRLVSATKRSEISGGLSSSEVPWSNRDLTSLSSFRSSQSSSSKLPSRALYQSTKAERFFKTTDDAYVMSDSGLKTKPSSFRPFNLSIYSLEESDQESEEEVEPEDNFAKDPLPLEGQTTEILDRIYPTGEGEQDIVPSKKRLPGYSPSSTTESFGPSATFRMSSQSRLGSSSRMRGTKSSNFTSTVSGHSTAGSRSNDRPAPALYDERAQTMYFRSKLIIKLATLKRPFEGFARKTASGKKEVSQPDFLKFMEQHFKGRDREDCLKAFEFLDAAGTGAISVDDFELACEAAAPAKTMEALRYKLVAFGYPTMQQAVNEMETTTRKSWEPYGIHRRLSYFDFSSALSKVGIETEDERQALFEFLTSSTENETVSLGEVAAALSAVGPPLLLEEVRFQLLARFKSLEEAWNVLSTEDLNDDGSVSIEEWGSFLNYYIKMTRHEARRAFRLIDIDDNGSLSRTELLGGLRLVEPGLFLEVARKQVRQRWRSIDKAFHWYISAVETFDPQVMERSRTEADQLKLEQAQHGGEAYLSLNELKYILDKVSLTEDDVELLYSRIDIDSDEQLTSTEFTRGIRLFAPSCALDDLRLRCVAEHSGVRSAFDKLNADMKSTGLTSEDFRKALEELDVVSSDTNIIFDLTERATGGLYINELVIALNAAAPGTNTLLTAEQQEAKVHQQVGDDMAPFQTLAADTHESLRQKYHKPLNGSLPMGSSTDPGSYYCSSSAWEENYRRKRGHCDYNITIEKRKAKKSASAPTLPSLSGASSSSHAHTFSHGFPGGRRQRPVGPPRWVKVDRSRTMELLYNCSPDPFRSADSDYRDGVEEYFGQAADHLAADRNMLITSPASPLKQFRKMQEAARMGAASV